MAKRARSNREIKADFAEKRHFISLEDIFIFLSFNMSFRVMANSFFLENTSL